MLALTGSESALIESGYRGIINCAGGEFQLSSALLTPVGGDTGLTREVNNDTDDKQIFLLELPIEDKSDRLDSKLDEYFTQILSFLTSIFNLPFPSPQSSSARSETKLTKHHPCSREHELEERGKEKEGEEKNKKKVLIGCAAGVSRSVSVALAFLIHTQHMSLHEAFTLVRSKRPFAYPNSQFWLYLMDLEQRVRGRRTVSLNAIEMHVVRPGPYFFSSLR